MTMNLAGLESDLKTQQQKNLSVEKQLEDAESKVKQLSKDMERKVEDLLQQENEKKKEAKSTREREWLRKRCDRGVYRELLDELRL